MVRKSKRGVVGKSNPTSSHRYKVGPGIDFAKHNLTNGSEIAQSNLNASVYKELE